MASFDEFVSAVQSNIEALKQAQTGMDTAKQQAEELSSQFQGLGAEAMATGSQGLKQGMEEAQNSVNPVITHLEQMITQAQGMKGLNPAGGAGVSNTHTRPPPTPLDAAPTDLKEPVAKVGDPVTAPDSGPGSFRQELKPADDGDSGMSKSRRAGRLVARNISGVQGQAKETASARTDTAMAFETVETVGVPEPAESISAGSASPVSTPDTVSTAVLAAAFAFEGLARLLDRRRSRR